MTLRRCQQHPATVADDRLMSVRNSTIVLSVVWACAVSCSQPRPYVAPDGGVNSPGMGGAAGISAAGGSRGSGDTGGALGMTAGPNGGTAASAMEGGGFAGQGMGGSPTPTTGNQGGGGKGGQESSTAGGRGGEASGGVPDGGKGGSLITASGGAGGFAGAGGGTACTSASCCPLGRLSCGGLCVDPSVNDANCGDCGNTCATTQMCKSGKCALRDGQPCATSKDCASSACNIFFRDEDGDGYGSPTSSIGRCATPSAPAGYVTNSQDCCDNGGNLLIAAKIHPGAEFQSVSAGGLCGVGWDYDCNGAIDLGPDFDAFTYCQVPCSDPVCQQTVCQAEPRRQDPNAAAQCGVGVFQCNYFYAGFPTQSCEENQTAVPMSAPEFRYFTCR